MKKLLLLFALMLGSVGAQALPFVTTTGPSNYPIHWYQLKINGMYLYAHDGQWTEVDASSTASTADAYLWCFVTTSSGKTLIFNKAKRQYMRSGYSFTDNMSHSSINYVEEGSGNAFYICFNAEGTKFYLNYDADNGLHSPSWKMNAFTAIEALVQEQAPTPNGEIQLELEEYDDYCMLNAVYTGTEEHTLTLNVNGNDVNNPYRITRTYQDKELDVIVTVTFNDMDPITEQETIIVPAIEAQPFTGYVEFHVTNEEKNCIVEADYIGSGTYSIKLYADGNVVSNPYTVTRGNVDKQITFLAVVTGPGRIPMEATEIITIPKYEEPELDLTFTAFSLSSNVPNPMGEEGFMKLFDRDVNTKWRVTFEDGTWQTIFVDFRADKSFVPTGYVMTTGDNTNTYPDRNPKAWKIYGKASWEDDDWEPIVTVTDGAAAGLGTNNLTDYNFSINGMNKEYRLFRFEVSEIRGKEGPSGTFQLAELRLRGKAKTALAGDVNGDGVVSGADVTTLYNVLLDNATAAGDADVNGDSIVSGADVTALYNLLLGQ